MAYSLSATLLLGAGNTGLTLAAALFDSANVAAAGLTTTTLVETDAGTGVYLWTGTVPDGHRGLIKFSSAGVVKTAVSVNAQELENPDVKTSTRSSHSAADVWAVGTRTLTSFGTLVADTAAAVWAYATRTLTTAITAVTPPPVVLGTTLTIVAGDTFVVPFTDLGDITGRSKLWFSIKDDPDDADTEAVVFIEETAGLQYLNGSAGTSGQGSILVTDEATGYLAVTLDEAATVLLSRRRGRFYSVKVIDSGVADTLSRGSVDVTWSAVKAIS